MEAKAGENGFNFGFDARRVEVFEGEVDLAHLFEGFGVRAGTRIESFEFCFELFEFFLEFLCFAKSGFGFFVDGFAFDMNPFLREITDAVVLGFGDFATIRLENSADALH